MGNDGSDGLAGDEGAADESDVDEERLQFRNVVRHRGRRCCSAGINEIRVSR